MELIFRTDISVGVGEPIVGTDCRNRLWEPIVGKDCRNRLLKPIDLLQLMSSVLDAGFCFKGAAVLFVLSLLLKVRTEWTKRNE